MAGELIEVATAGATLWLVADRPDASPDYLVHGLRLTVTTASGAAASVELRFMDELTLPVELVGDAAGRKRLDTFEALREKVDALRSGTDEAAWTRAAALLDAMERLRGELERRPLRVDAQSKFFGVRAFAGAVLEAVVELPLPSLASTPGSGRALSLRGIATASVDAAVAGRTIGATATLLVAWSGDVPRFELDVELPAFPEFDLTFRVPRLPSLRLDVELPALERSGLAVALPLPATRIEWDGGDPPAYRARVDAEGAFELSTAGPRSGALLIDLDSGGAVEIGRVVGYEARAGADGVVLRGDVRPTDGEHTIVDDRTYSGATDDTFPFFVRVVDWRVAVRAGTAPARFELVHTIARVEAIAKSDPSLSIALAAGWTMRAEGGGLTTTLNRLDILAPYPVALVAAGIRGATRWLTLIGAIPLPKAGVPSLPGSAAVLQRLHEMLAAAATWTLRAIDSAARATWAVVEAIVGALGKFVDAVSTLAATHLAIEARFDPETLALRQLYLSPLSTAETAATPFRVEMLGIALEAPAGMRPSLFADFGAGPTWALIVRAPSDGAAKATIATDLWLGRAGAAAEPLRDATADGARPASRLVTVEASLGADRSIALIAVRDGEPRFLRAFRDRPDAVVVIPGTPGHALALVDDAALLDDPLGAQVTVSVALAPDAAGRLLPLFPATVPSDGSSLVDKLGQYVSIEKPAAPVRAEGDRVDVPVDVVLHLGQLEPTARLVFALDLRTLSARASGDGRVVVKGERRPPKRFAGLDVVVLPREDALPDDAAFEQFVLDLSSGDARLALASAARVELSYAKIAAGGRGLVFVVDTFAVSRSGLDLTARVSPEHPVRLAGIDMPFRFDAGTLVVRSGRLVGASLSGRGQLPPALVGEADIGVAIGLGRSAAGDLIVECADAWLDKADDPLVCEAIGFRFTVEKLGFRFVESNGYHFYATLTGSARFDPKGGEWASGLLKSLSNVEIRLEDAPLAGDASVLAQKIDFRARLDPPAQARLFGVFAFEVRCVAFDPRSVEFDGSPAFCVGGQIAFTATGDVPSPRIDCHRLCFAPSEDGAAPRVRCEGLAVALDFPSVRVEGTAIAVDDPNRLPSLNRGAALPPAVTTEGFLAAGRIRIAGWAPMSAAMGFLELREGDAPPKHAFFLFVQQERLSEPIPTPIGTLYLREAGYGFGFRYTLAGLAGADAVSTPGELIALLDEVSKYQGSLHDFRAWQPQYRGDRFTLAMRALFTMRSASTSGSLDPREAELPNPVLFDVVAALRSDFTFLMTARAWLAVNYADWDKAGPGAEWKTKPGLRGYLYVSAAQRKMLGRFVADPAGHIGEHPALPEPLKRALRALSWSSTLYVAPGLFHQEYGWPYELGFEMDDSDGLFGVSCRGGLVLRVEDGAVLYGLAFRAAGFARIGGRVGGSGFGAAAEATVDFAADAKFLAYVSATNFGETLFYGALKLDLSVRFSVSVWLQLDLPFGRKLRFETGFAAALSIAVAIELAVRARAPVLGGRATASIGVSAFGRSLTLGVGFGFNEDFLAEARTRVARFLALGLAAQYPDPEGGPASIGGTPPIEPSRAARSERADAALLDEAERQDVLAPIVATDVPGDDGRPLAEADFWAMLFPTARSETDPSDAGGNENAPWYVLQLLPRDHTCGWDGDATRDDRGSFFAAPAADDWKHVLLGFEPGTVLRAIGADGRTHALEADADGRIATVVQRHATVEPATAAGEESVELEAFVRECFVAAAGGALREPRTQRVSHRAERLPRDEDSATRRLAAFARDRGRMNGALLRDQIVEERRSAVAAAVGESAASIARDGRSGVYPRRADRGIDARDFGLTFLVSERELEELFGESIATDRATSEPPIARFSVRSLPEPSGTVAGTVRLFNPPARLFVRAQPYPRCRPTARIEKGRVLLDWDLEPAWRRSGSDRTRADPGGAYDDPEYHLKHYEVRRTISGFAEPPPPRPLPTSKCGAAKEADLAGEPGVEWRWHRPPYQIVDDLADLAASHPRIYDALLAAAAPAAGIGSRSDARDAAAVWAEAFGAGTQTVELQWHVVPADEAGTKGDGWPVELTLRAPKPVRRPLRRAEATFRYAAMPRLDAPAEPTPTLFLDDPAWAESTDHAPPSYALRVRPLRRFAPGPFGADTLSDTAFADATTVLGPLRPDEAEFVLHPEKDDYTKPDRIDVRFEAVPKSEPGSEPKTNYRYRIAIESGANRRAAFNEAIGAGKALRIGGVSLFIRTAVTADGEPTETPWRRADARIVVDRTDSVEEARQRAAGAAVAAASEVVLDRFEHPIDARFRALDGCELDVDVGRLQIVRPPTGATLADLLDGNASPETLGDPGGRTAVRLEWNARPSTAAFVEPVAADARRASLPLIAGFDLFTIDPEALEPYAGTDVYANRLARQARFVGRAVLAPLADRASWPTETTKFDEIDAYYPSHTARRPANGADDAGRPWYSAAESVPLWPERAWRRSLALVPDEIAIAALFERGVPIALEARVSGLRAAAGTLGVEYELACEPAWNVPDVACAPPATTGDDPALVLKGKLTPRTVREFLCRLVWNTGDTVAPAVPRGARGASVRLTLRPTYAGGEAGIPGRAVELAADLDPGDLHAVLADTLDILRYDRVETTDAAGPLRFGYRRYEPVLEPAPPVDAPRLAAWLDRTPTQRDPHGWGILRTLGLAAAVRLYDTETQEYVVGRALLERLAHAFDAALARYRPLANAGRLGVPFADIASTGNCLYKTASFDGGSYGAPGDAVIDASLPTVQLALRPAADRLIRSVDARRSVRYFELRSKDAADEVVLRLRERPGGMIWADVVDTTRASAAPRSVALAATETSDELQEPSSGNSLRIDLRGRESEFIALARICTVGLHDEEFDKELVFEVSGASIAIDEIEQPRAVVDPSGSALGASEPFGRFDALTARRAAVLSCPSPAEAPAEGVWRVRPSVADGFHRFVDLVATRFPEEFSSAEAVAGYALRPPAPEATGRARAKDAWFAERAGLFARLLAWSQRFLDHGPARVGSDTPIGYAIAVLLKPEPWRVAANHRGRCGAVFVEEPGYAQRRRYLVRPFGRFEALAEAASGTLRPRDLVDALPDDVERTAPWIDAFLPRTRPAAAPVTLWAARSDRTDAAGSIRLGEGLELVTSRTTDELFADTNAPVRLGVSQPEVAVGYFREFAHAAWASAFGETRLKDGFGEGVVGRPEPVGRGRGAYEAVRRRVPDAWAGAARRIAHGLPYFFRIHALAYAAAGVTVSDTAAATFEEGYYELAWPAARPSDGDTVDRCRWSVRRAENGETRLVVRVPAVRFVDCMDEASRSTWLGARPEADWPPLFVLPDPLVAYRVSIGWANGAASVEPEVEVLPTPPESIADATRPSISERLYAATCVGPRLRDGRVAVRSDGLSPRRAIELDAALVPGSGIEPPAAPAFTVPEAIASDVVFREIADADLPGTLGARWLPSAPTANAALTVRAPSGGAGEPNWAALRDESEAFARRLAALLSAAADQSGPRIDAVRFASRIFERAATIADRDAWAALANDLGGELVADGLSVRFGLIDWPLGAVPLAGRVAELSFDAPQWPDRPPTGRPARRAFEDVLDRDDAPEGRRALPIVRTALREHWLASRRHADASSNATGVAPIWRPMPFDEDAMAAEVPASLDFVQRYRLTRDSAQSAPDAIDALFGVFEGGEAGGSLQAAQAVVALATWEEGASGPVELFVSTRRSKEAQDAFAALAPAVGYAALDEAAVVLRVPPTDDEIAAVPSPLRSAVSAAAAEQLFGADRVPVVDAYRGLAAAVRQVAVRDGLPTEVEA